MFRIAFAVHAVWMETIQRYIVDGQKFEVEFRAFPKYLWLAAGFEVRVGGVTFLPVERLQTNITMTKFDFESSGRRRHGVVRSLHMSQSLRRKTQYEVVIDGEVIAQDVQAMRGWYLSYLALLLIGVNVVFWFAFGTLILRIVSETFAPE